MGEPLFYGKGTNLGTGKEIRFRVPATMSHKGLETIMRNIHIKEVQASGSTFRRPDSFVDRLLAHVLSSAEKRDNTLQEYCGILSRRLAELLMLKGFPADAARFEFTRAIIDGRISILPRLCVNEERIQDDGQFLAFMHMVHVDLPVEFPEFSHPCEGGKGASA